MAMPNWVWKTASSGVSEAEERPRKPLIPPTTWRHIAVEDHRPRFQFPFLELPYDLRLEVYGHLMPKLPFLDIRGHAARDRFLTYGSLTPGLLRANRQIYLEYSRMMYGSSTFILTEARDFYYFLMFTSKQCLAHIRSISVTSPCVRYLYQEPTADFSAWGRAWAVVGGEMKQLQSLRLVMYSSLHGCHMREELMILEPLRGLRGVHTLSIEDHGTKGGERELKLRNLGSTKEDVLSLVEAEEELHRLARLPRRIQIECGAAV